MKTVEQLIKILEKLPKDAYFEMVDGHETDYNFYGEMKVETRPWSEQSEHAGETYEIVTATIDYN